MVSRMRITKVQNKFYHTEVPESSRNGQMLVKFNLYDKLCHDFKNSERLDDEKIVLGQ